MKQLARKSSHISLVPPVEQESDRPAVSPFLDEFFDAWLATVSPTLVTSEAMKPGSSKVAVGKRPLTSTDVTRVNRATVRESTDHRHWPPGVVQTFLVANVVKRNGGK
jgi:hypothetical protein